MYFADRVNKGVSVIDTVTNTYLGTLVVPTCTGVGSCPSGVVVAPDLHKLVVTDRVSSGVDLPNIFIYDLRLLSAPPVKLTLASGSDTDELDYDPLNHRAYVGNTVAPFFVTVVDLKTNTIVDSIPLPGNPEQPRFNPVDGFIYVTIPDDATIATGGPHDSVLRIDPTKTGAAAIVATFTPPAGCAVRGIDVDPVTNTGVIGCAGGASQYLLDFATGNVLTQYPNVTGTDTLAFNPNLRRWYTASSNNTNSGVACPQDSTTAFPVIGVFAAPTKKNQIAAIVGAECSGRNGHGIGVEPFDNQVYTGVRQFPADPASATTGTRGVLVFLDPAPLAQPKLVEESQANLQGNGKVRFIESYIVQANLRNLPGGTPTLLNITTTVGNEVVDCDVAGSNATCSGVLKGAALIGGEVILATAGTPVAKGRITKEDDDGHGKH
jgi:DNA-binding beta-propeller fold protein YncE